jgi:hypothetical protein
VSVIGGVAGGGVAEGPGVDVGWTVALGEIDVWVRWTVALGAIDVRVALGVGVRRLVQPITRNRTRKRSGLFFDVMISKVLLVCSESETFPVVGRRYWVAPA